MDGLRKAGLEIADGEDVDQQDRGRAGGDLALPPGRADRRRRHGRGLSRQDTSSGATSRSRCCPPRWRATPSASTRFQREARAVAALNHPNIVTLYSVEEADGVHFLTMELVEGQTLDRLIPAGGLPLERILEIASAARRCARRGARARASSTAISSPPT